ncbi:alpha/beta fold hydrolase [Deinococcus sp. HMF7620]|uniref:Alpha/beta fold hydrolase n=1 Tax=Deinococcus arboris TaxID=2682977 RepID=A0A7C9MAY2_9DEIO|nr:alpha/beta fold hydrolase [Deinococcus arboris]MVN88723.1 alpha/beta fold hydrolase [Deinococcus arboris]
MSPSPLPFPESLLGSPAPVVSVRPLILDAPGRGDALQVRVTAPTTGDDLPVLLFAHGFGKSMDAYAPLTEFWAAHGFVVIQPTFLDSRTLNVTPDDPRSPEIWCIRAHDLRVVLDQLSRVEAAVPGLRGRLNQSRTVAVGHSWGGQSVSLLLGARVRGPDGQPGESLADPRVQAGILLATPGEGGASLTPFAAQHFPFMNPDFVQLTVPNLVVAGDRDQSLLSTRGPDWFAEPYFLSPGSTDLLTLFGAEHSLGGISGYGVTETTDEHPERVALLQRLTWAYLRSALDPADSSWAQARAALNATPDGLGRIESKPPGHPRG